jgi:hypothetical protein
MSKLHDELLRNLAILELEPGVSWQQVKDRYRFLAKVWHPDRFGADIRARSRAEQQFKTVNTTYQWLLQHRSEIDSLANDSQSGRKTGESLQAGEGSEQQDRVREREEPPSRPPRAPKVEKEQGSSAIEKFLWGVVSTFTLIAVVIFLVSSLPGWLSRQGSENGQETTRGMLAPTSSEQGTGDEGTGGGSHGVKWVTASRLYVRSEPSPDAPVVSVLERGSRVRIQSGGGTWLAVVSDDGRAIGWLHGDYVGDRAPGSPSSSSDVARRAQQPVVDTALDFTAFARSHQAGDGQMGLENTSLATENSTQDLELIRGAWKPKNPDPFKRENPQDGAGAGLNPDLDRWSGAVDGAAPRDLPRVTVRLYDDAVAGQAIGTAVYWHPAGACTYSLELQERVGDWLRTEQIEESSGCAPQGEIWFFAGETEMTAIWHRPDGSQWFSSRLRMN